MKKILSLFLIVIMLFTTVVFANSSVYLTATNDTIIEYKKDNQPTAIGGRICIPYTVFGGLGISASYNNNTKILVLYNIDKIVTLDITQGTIRDEKSNYYAGSPYMKNSTVFVPVDVICNIFGFQYSTVISKTSTLRITNGYEKLSTEVFKTYADTTYETVALNLLNDSSSVGPEQPLKEITIHTIYPMIKGETSKSQLDNFSEKSLTFFISEDSFKTPEDVVYSALKNQQLGIFVPSEISENYIDTINYIEKLNDKIFQLCGKKTRLITFEDEENSSFEIEKDGYIIIKDDFTSFSQTKIEASKLKSVSIDFSSTRYISNFIKYADQMKIKLSTITEF